MREPTEEELADLKEKKEDWIKPDRAVTLGAKVDVLRKLADAVIEKYKEEEK